MAKNSPALPKKPNSQGQAKAKQDSRVCHLAPRRAWNEERVLAASQAMQPKTTQPPTGAPRTPNTHSAV